jgi:hypothetical protein
MASASMQGVPHPPFSNPQDGANPGPGSRVAEFEFSDTRARAKAPGERRLPLEH